MQESRPYPKQHPGPCHSHISSTLACQLYAFKEVKDGPLFFIGGVTIFGTCRQYFLKSNAFQTIFFITFCNGNNFFTTIFKKCYGLFYRSYLKKSTSCACIHMRSLI